jgi:hypothetical protein
LQKYGHEFIVVIRADIDPRLPPPFIPDNGFDGPA